MELNLNYGWVLAAIASVCLRLRLGRRALVDGRMSFVGLFRFIVILFLVISVSDDLRSIRRPAETRTLLRRDPSAIPLQSVYRTTVSPPEPAVAELSFGFQHLGAPQGLPFWAVENPALDPIQSRPPLSS